MPIAEVLLLTGLLAQAPISPMSTAALGVDATGARAAMAAQSGTQPSDGTPDQTTDRVHEVGIGVAMGVGTSSGGGGFRMFFGDRFGFNLNAGVYRPQGTGGSSQGSTFFVAPSAVYMLTKSRKYAAVDVRPYIGGGLNYANGSGPVQTTRTATVASTSGLGMQVFGGAELTFQDAKSLAISAEVAHYQMAVSGVSTDLGQGTHFYVLVHYYLK